MNINHWLLWQQTQTILWQSQHWFFFDNKDNYDSLINIITDHNHLYYIDNTPIISDVDYDILFTLLKEFEALHPEIIRDDSPTQQLKEQYEIQENFQKANHSIPILSLQNTYNIKDIRDWYESITTMLEKSITTQDEKTKDMLQIKLQTLNFFLEPKYDGLAIVLTYEQWKLVKAVTRWDGYTGDDVTENIRTIKNIPHTLSDKQRVIVRGEVMMPTSRRKMINQQRSDNNQEPFSNTRNAAAGSLKLLDTNEVAKRWLVCYIYDILVWSPSLISEFENLNYLTQTQSQYTIEEISTLIEQWSLKDSIAQADVDFDGLVIKLADSEMRELLWSTNHHPRRAIAYKFPAQQAATQIEHIERQVGRTGILTPVAHLTPTALSGVTISRVSLHNIDFIQNKDIRIHDWVRLQRSGEVIPYIVSVISQRRNWSETIIDSDQIQCPACHTKAQTITNTVGTKTNPLTTTQLICPNPHCSWKLKEKLKHFVSKNAMNIASLGDATLDMLVDQQIIQSLSDIYTLTQPETIFLLKRFPGIGHKKVDTFIEEIITSKTNPLWRFINALGISGIGIKLAKEIEKHLNYRPVSAHTLEQIFTIINNPEFLESIYGVGEKLIQEIHEWYNDPESQTLLSAFSKYGILPTNPMSSSVTNDRKTICITWTFPLSRSELEFFIHQAWFIFTPNLTKTTDYLLVGTHAGNKKDKAWPHTKVLDNIQEIYSLLNISVPLFEDNHKSEQPSGWEMQSLFG